MFLKMRLNFFLQPNARVTGVTVLAKMVEAVGRKSTEVTHAIVQQATLALIVKRVCCILYLRVD